jgi:hypothetical protein
MDALSESGSYELTFVLPDGTEHHVVVRARDAAAHVPAANLPAALSIDSPAFTAALDAVVAMERARRLVTGSTRQLVDVPGGWDVVIGNVALVDGAPTCMAHGPLVPESADQDTGRYVCPECGAAALYGELRSVS